MRHNKIYKKPQFEFKLRFRAFTLIEVMVIVVILAVAMQLVVGILVTIIRQQSATMRLSTVKQEGDRIMLRIKSEIDSKVRNSRVFDQSATPVSTCNNSTVVSQISFKDSANSPFSFVTPTGTPTNGQVLLNQSAVISTLNSSKTNITGFAMQCVKSGAYSNKLVSVSFDIESATTGLAAEGSSRIRYSSLIQIKP